MECSYCGRIHETEAEVRGCPQRAAARRRRDRQRSYRLKQRRSAALSGQTRTPQSDFSETDILNWWQSQWGSLSPEMQRRFLARPEVSQLLLFPIELVREAISLGKRLVNILTYVRKRYDDPGYGQQRFGSDPDDGPFGSGPVDGGSRSPRHPFNPSRHPGLKKKIPKGFNKSPSPIPQPKWLEVPEKESPLLEGFKKTA